MAGNLIRYDLSLPSYNFYPPAPGVDTRPMIPRKEERQLFMRGEFGIKPDGRMRPISAHNTTHLDAPFHFISTGKDMAAVLNHQETVGDRPALARVVSLAGQAAGAGAITRFGVTYCDSVSGAQLPPVGELSQYDALVLLTGFGKIMAQQGGAAFSLAEDGSYHVPHLQTDAVDRILESGLGLVAIDSPGVEPEIGIEPLRYSSEVHLRLLGHEPPVLILEALGGGDLARQVGFMPAEALLHMVPRRVNEQGADAAHGRAFLYFYRDDPGGEALRRLTAMMTPGELYG